MGLSHYSVEPLAAVRSVAQNNTEVRGLYKPLGLWVSVDGDDDWPNWCDANTSPSFVERCTRTIVHLAKNANLLWLTTAETVVAFDRSYCTAPPDIIECGRYVRAPDWERVAQVWQGIIIAPYQWSLRCDLMWYYGWGCASGCIWDAAAIERLEADTAWQSNDA